MFHSSVIVLLLLSLTACGSSPKTYFYTLNAEDAAKEIIQDKKNNSISVGVWQVTIPSLLDRAEMVTRNGQYGIEIADFHKWADGLADNITRVISSELNHRLKTNRAVVSPWLAYIKHDYQIRVQIDRLDGELGGEMVMSGVWSLLGTKGHKELLRETFLFKTTAKGKNYNDMAAAFSNLTAQLSEKMANTIKAQ